MKLETLKVRSTVSEAIGSFYQKNGFYEVNPPILTSFSCEVACVGGSDLLSVNFFNKMAFLSQSAQLYLESLAMQLGKVYCVNPAFRAESTVLATHLSEFWMCEAEMTNVDFDKLVQNVRNLLAAIISHVLEKNWTELKSLGSDISILERVAKKPIPYVSYSDAIRILKGKGVPIESGEDFLDSHKQTLCQYFDNLPLIITFYPKSLSTFYKQVCVDNQDFTSSFDVIAPCGFGELASGSMRETDITKLRESLAQFGVDATPYEWYFDMLSSYSRIHGGYGLGVERLITWLCNLSTIQEAIPFPRTEKILCP